jgi:uncharacterized membrane protein YidH (DUF202 family)
MTPPALPPNDPANSPGPSDLDDLDERDPGLAVERTSLAWTRTAISFAALGAVVLKVSVFPGLIIVLMAPLVWWVGGLRKLGAHRHWLITVSVVVVAILSLLVALIGHGASRALHS